MVTSGSVLGATIKNYCSTHSWNRKARLSIYWHRLTLLLCCFLCCLQVTDSPAERPALLKVAMTSMFLASWKYMFLTPFSTFGISDAAVWDPRITRWLWRMTKCHIGENNHSSLFMIISLDILTCCSLPKWNTILTNDYILLSIHLRRVTSIDRMVIRSKALIYA